MPTAFKKSSNAFGVQGVQEPAAFKKKFKCLRRSKSSRAYGVQEKVQMPAAFK
jgi:hypothetical protein